MTDKNNNARGTLNELLLVEALVTRSTEAVSLQVFKDTDKHPDYMIPELMKSLGPTTSTAILEWTTEAARTVMVHAESMGLAANTTDIVSVAWTPIRDTETSQGDHFKFTGKQDPNADGDVGIQTSKGIIFISAKFGSERNPGLRNPGRATLEKIFGVSFADLLDERDRRMSYLGFNGTVKANHDLYKSHRAANTVKFQAAHGVGQDILRRMSASIRLVVGLHFSEEMIKDLIKGLASPDTVFPHARLHTRVVDDTAVHRIHSMDHQIIKLLDDYEDFALMDTVNTTIISFDAKNKFTGERQVIAKLHLKWSSGPMTSLKGSLTMPAFDRKEKKRVFHGFDMDDTLFWYENDTAPITYVMGLDGEVARLTPHEYAAYSLKPGEYFDYTEFQDASTFLKTANPIKKMQDLYDKLKDKGSSHIAIVTARNYFDDHDLFIETMNNLGFDCPIHMAGAKSEVSTSSARKKIVFRELIQANKYDEVHIYDDSMNNISAVLSLDFEFPDVKFIGHHVTHDPVKNKTIVKKIMS